MSLEALQRAALGQGQGKVVDWLKSRGLERSPRLAQQLSVDTGWDRAVETVLGGYLEAVCVDSIDDVAGTLESLHGRHRDVLCGRAGPGRQRVTARDTLRSRVRGPAGSTRCSKASSPPTRWPTRCGCGRSCAPGQSVITRDGIWIGPDWLRVSRDKDAHEGVIEREQRPARASARRSSGSRRGTASSTSNSRRCAPRARHSRTGSRADQSQAVAQRHRAT